MHPTVADHTSIHYVCVSCLGIVLLVYFGGEERRLKLGEYLADRVISSLRPLQSALLPGSSSGDLVWCRKCMSCMGSCVG